MQALVGATQALQSPQRKTIPAGDTNRRLVRQVIGLTFTRGQSTCARSH